MRLDLVWYCAPKAGAVGTLIEDEVRKARHCDSQIRVGVGCPRVLEATISRHGDGEWWKLIGVRPGAADDFFNLAFHPVRGHDLVDREFGNWRTDVVDVEQGL